jgi:hypothetical protein
VILDDDESRHVCFARASSCKKRPGHFPPRIREKSQRSGLSETPPSPRGTSPLSLASPTRRRAKAPPRACVAVAGIRVVAAFSSASPSKNRPGLRPPRPEDRLGANRDVTSASRADRDGQVPARQAPREGVLRRGDARDPGDGPEQEIRRGACVARPAPRSGERPRGPGSAFHDGQGRGAVEKVNANRSRAIGTRPRRPRTRRHPRFAFRFVERLD